LLVLVLSTSGCLSQSYEISVPELERLVELPPEERGESVRVTQQTSFGSDLGNVDVAQLSSEDDDFASFLGASSTHHRHHNHRRRHARHEAKSEDGDDADGAAERAMATAVVVVAAAATVAVTVGITEGARFDGWMAAPPEHPMLLVDGDGRRHWTRLEELSRDDLRRVDRAVLPDLAGDLYRLERHPLDRQGFVYQLELGAESTPLGGSGAALSGRAGLGYMPDQLYGVLVGAAFSSARPPGGDGAAIATSEATFDYRTFLQGECWPLAVGRLHAGPYAELGYAWALADDLLGSREVHGPMVALGGALQLDVTTRLAMTLRLGAAWLPSIDAAAFGTGSGYRLSPALTIGASIY
jgi:hypothetical protein